MNNRELAGRLPRRCYSKKELAALYFPESEARVGVRHLFNWIERCGPLMRELEASGYFKGQRTMYPRQVGVIFDYLGEPDWEMI